MNSQDYAEDQKQDPLPGPVKNGRHDVLTHRIVIVSLGATVLLAALNTTVLQSLGYETPPSLAHLGSTAIGALAMTLANIMRPH